MGACILTCYYVCAVLIIADGIALVGARHRVRYVVEVWTGRQQRRERRREVGGQKLHRVLHRRHRHRLRPFALGCSVRS